jgi:hypothetical protein
MTPKSIVIAWVASAALSPMSTAAGRLTQRVWLEQAVPGEATLTALRAGGIDGVVLPVGDVEVAGKTCRFTPAPLPDLKALAGWAVTPLVWVSGANGSSGDAEKLLAELAPVQRLLPGGASMVLAARTEWEGLLGFAEDVARRRGAPVELLLPAQALPRIGLASVPSNVRLIAAALGNPPSMGFPATTPADDLAALEQLDDAGVPYRVAIVVTPRSTPPPGPGGASLTTLASPSVSEYRPADRGDAFMLRRQIDWGGTALAAGTTVQVDAVDTARLHRDLGLVLRPVRPRLEGWDVVVLPNHEPTLGLSLEAFLDYLQGGTPFPTPVVQPEWVTPTRLRVALANPTPHGSAVASTGNFVELRFSGTQLLDVGLGDFSGTDYGRIEQETWHRTVARDANAVRLFVTYVPPVSRVAGAAVTFFGRPSAVSVRWVVRLGDGTEAAGGVEAVPAIRRP